MTLGWLAELADMVAVHGPVVRVSIVRADGDRKSTRLNSSH